MRMIHFILQAYQGAGETVRAEKSIDELRKWWKAGRLDGTSMAEERSFVRDQFWVGKYRVMAFEFFEPDHKKREHTWDFCVFEGDNQVAMYYVILDEVANSASKAQSTPYYFDVRWSGGGGTLVGMTLRPPTYAEAASVIKRSLKGEKVGPLIELP